jgi:hypothetical protein
LRVPSARLLRARLADGRCLRPAPQRAGAVARFAQPRARPWPSRRAAGEGRLNDVQSSRAQVERDPRGEAGRNPGVATSIVVTAWTRRAVDSRRVREWMAWRRYLVATTTSSGLEAYLRREEDAWARLVEELAETHAPGLSGVDSLRPPRRGSRKQRLGDGLALGSSTTRSPCSVSAP